LGIYYSKLVSTTIVVGESKCLGRQCTPWAGPYLVAEADESDGSLVKLAAKIGVVTNIELDHPDHYQTLEEVVATFEVFAKRCQTL